MSGEYSTQVATHIDTCSFKELQKRLSEMDPDGRDKILGEQVRLTTEWIGVVDRVLPSNQGNGKTNEEPLQQTIRFTHGQIRFGRIVLTHIQSGGRHSSNESALYMKKLPSNEQLSKCNCVDDFLMVFGTRSDSFWAIDAARHDLLHETDLLSDLQSTPLRSNQHPESDHLLAIPHLLYHPK